MKHLFWMATVIISLTACKREKAPYFENKKGYYSRLISFGEPKAKTVKGCIAHVSATFSNQADSVFWESYGNFNNRLFLRIDAHDKASTFIRAISTFEEQDSACLLIRSGTFFEEQFKSDIPYFSRGDSVVKVNFRLIRLYCGNQYNMVLKSLREQEDDQIRTVVNGSRNVKEDVAGFYWVSRDSCPARRILPGEKVRVIYTGRYLNGRFLESSPANFEYTFGTPDQLITGLNYVIGRLKLGQNAKIILPSRLAFGEQGSSNGTVPPFTPLIYEIKIEPLNGSENED